MTYSNHLYRQRFSGVRCYHPTPSERGRVNRVPTNASLRLMLTTPIRVTPLLLCRNKFVPSFCCSDERVHGRPCQVRTQNSDAISVLIHRLPSYAAVRFYGLQRPRFNLQYFEGSRNVVSDFWCCVQSSRFAYEDVPRCETTAVFTTLIAEGSRVDRKWRTFHSS